MYIQESFKLLSNPAHYEKIPLDPTADYQVEVSSTIRSFIRSQSLPPEAHKLIPSDPRCSIFYILPKIHKDGNPGRPIVSTISCPTSIISDFIDSICQPILINTPSYLKDTKHCLQILNDFHFCGNQRFIITGDVQSLYTVISHEKGLISLKHFLDNRVVQQPPTSVIIRLAELVLKLNAFKFNNEYYKQVSGVAMGTKMGPVFACLHLAYLEQKFFESYTGPVPTLFKRYVDDYLLFFSCPPEQVNSFLSQYSNIDNEINITWSNLSSQAPFLDISISITEGSDQVQTTVYSKPTDSHSYLLFNSFHPKHLLTSIPFSQFLRLRRICSDEANFISLCDQYKSYFLNRGYPSRLLDRAISKAHSRNRHELLFSSRPRNNDKVLPLVVTHSPLSESLSNKSTSLFKDIISQDNITSPIFPNPPVKSFRKPSSLRNLLVRSDISSNRQRETDPYPGTFPCLRKTTRKCVTCDHTNPAPIISTNVSKFYVKKHYSCTTECLIYAITCTNCPNTIYIGETGKRLGDRFQQHRYDIINNNNTAVGCHFNLPNHSLENIKVSVLTQAPRPEQSRLPLENKIIFQFRSFRSPGLNTNFSFL